MNLEKYLNRALPLTFELRREVGSTNTLLKEMAAAGAGEGVVLIAERQTAGRGRQGRSFFSPEGGGLYLSLLLRPKFGPEQAAMLTVAAAAAAALAIEEISGKSTDIKWVNDVYMEGRKVCGILCEAAFTAEGGLDYVVVGVGINVLEPADGFPPELADAAGAVFAPAKAPVDARERIAAALLDNFMGFYWNMEARAYFPEYKKRCFLLGRRINVLRGGETTVATAIDINEAAHLLVRYPDGREEYLSSGEVSVYPEHVLPHE